MILETERFYLREMTIDDFEAFKLIWGDKKNMCFYHYDFTDEVIKHWIEGNIKRYDIFGFGWWAICIKDTGEVIGDCGLSMQPINKIIRPEIGYHIRLDYHNKGVAKEASIAIRDWAFTNTPFRTIYSYMNKDNIASRKTAMAYGASYEGEYIDNDGTVLTIYSLTRDTWMKLTKKVA